MLRRYITNGITIPIILVLQIVPLLIFPLSSYDLSSQEWWLPILLTVFTIAGLVELLIRKNTAAWPWYLLAFSQGFNIISRLMMILPHATETGSSGTIHANGSYLIITAISFALSAFEIWYGELPEVRQKIAYRATAKKPA